MMATFLPVLGTSRTCGCQPISKAFSVMYFSTLPMVTAPNSALSVQSPSHRRSCGQTRPHTSGRLLVVCANSAASMMRPSLAKRSQLGMLLCKGHLFWQ